MRSLLSFPLMLLLLALSLVPPVLADATQAKKILIVVSGEGRGEGNIRPGFEMDELSQAYLIFQKNGFAMDIASPQGGPVEVDKYDASEPFNAEFIGDAAAMQMLHNTLRTNAVSAKDYSAVYVVGGKGAMFDLPRDKALSALIRDVYEAGGVVGAVCHGPAALAHVRLSNGEHLIKNKNVTGFSNEEESVFGKRWKREFSFMLEDGLTEKGAQWQEAPLVMSHVVSDGRLVTGQNPYSTLGVAEAMLTALGRPLSPRKAWRDELTMELMKQAMQPEKLDAVRAKLKADTNSYHVQLIGLVGYYQLQTANSESATQRALLFMELARPYMEEPQLQVGIATAHQKLGNLSRARTLVKAVLDQHPDMAAAKKLWRSLQPKS